MEKGVYGPFFVISLMMPAATVVPMSLTAKRPSSSNSAKVSTAIGCSGSILTTAASPVFRKVGFSSTTCPVRGSIFLMSSVNLHAICPVW